MVQPRDPEPEHHYPPDMSVDPLDRLAAEAGVDEAVRRLGHQAWLRRRAEESASLSGLLADLAERQGRNVRFGGVAPGRRRLIMVPMGPEDSPDYRKPGS